VEGSFSDAGDIFICSECQADAKKLLENQDSIWPEIVDTGESTEGTEKSPDSSPSVYCANPGLATLNLPADTHRAIIPSRNAHARAAPPAFCVGASPDNTPGEQVHLGGGSVGVEIGQDDGQRSPIGRGHLVRKLRRVLDVSG
jgi:hypothetical protein